MKKRFIAGVTCPRCGTLDTITAVEDSEENVLIRECVECGFTDRLSTLVNAPKELSTRVTEDNPSEQSPSQIIKILES